MLLNNASQQQQGNPNGGMIVLMMMIRVYLNNFFKRLFDLVNYSILCDDDDHGNDMKNKIHLMNVNMVMLMVFIIIIDTNL